MLGDLPRAPGVQVRYDLSCHDTGYNTQMRAKAIALFALFTMFLFSMRRRVSMRGLPSCAVL